MIGRVVELKLHFPNAKTFIVKWGVLRNFSLCCGWWRTCYSYSMWAVEQWEHFFMHKCGLKINWTLGLSCNPRKSTLSCCTIMIWSGIFMNNVPGHVGHLNAGSIYCVLKLAVFAWDFTASGFGSKEKYLFGNIGMRMKLVPGDSAGTVTAYYVSLNWNLYWSVHQSLWSLYTCSSILFHSSGLDVVVTLVLTCDWRLRICRCLRRHPGSTMRWILSSLAMYLANPTSCKPMCMPMA